MHKTKPDALEHIEKAERSFRRTSAAAGVFEVRGHHVRTELHPSGWHTFAADLPLQGKAPADDGLYDALLRAHASFFGPVKFACYDAERDGVGPGAPKAPPSRYCLTADAPFERWTADISTSSAISLKAIKPSLAKALVAFRRLAEDPDKTHALRKLTTGRGAAVPSPKPCAEDCLHELCSRTRAIRATIEQYFTDTDLEWTERGGGWVAANDTDSYFQRINIEPLLKRPSRKIEPYLRVHSELVGFKNISEESRRALSYFLGRLNGRLRFARASLVTPTTNDHADHATETQVVLETILPGELISPFAVKKAVACIIAGARLARLETEALMDTEVALALLKC